MILIGEIRDTETMEHANELRLNIKSNSKRGAAAPALRVAG